MKRSLALAGVAALCGCGGPTAPTPDFVGPYSFVVEASSVCDMPVERFEWNLVATAAGGGQDDLGSFRLTLPGGDPTVSLNLSYVQRSGRRGNKKGDPTLSISLNVQDVQVGSQLRVTIGGSPSGTASVAGNGLGQVVDGSINGTIRLQEPGPRGPVEIGRCTAADHHFILTPS